MNNIVIIARREALFSVVLAVFYMLGWTLSAYAVPAHIMLGGWPLWFVLSCVFNPLLFIGLCTFMVQRCFKAVSLETNTPPALQEYLAQSAEKVTAHKVGALTLQHTAQAKTNAHFHSQ